MWLYIVKKYTTFVTVILFEIVKQHGGRPKSTFNFLLDGDI